MTARCYGNPPAGVKLDELKGLLIVIEGADGSGRSTQIEILKEGMESEGYAVVDFGLARSSLVSEELSRANEGNVLGHRTRSLFYATDLMDQYENVIIPALRSGFIVLCDRYFYTLMARDVVRGAQREWLEQLYSVTLVPDAVFYVKVSPNLLVERNFCKHQTLDYWESGMDLGLSNDMFESFMKYQRLIQREFAHMQEQYGFQIINGNRSIKAIATELRTEIGQILRARRDAPAK